MQNHTVSPRRGYGAPFSDILLKERHAAPTEAEGQTSTDARVAEARDMLAEALQRESTSATLLAEIEEKEARLSERMAAFQHKQAAFEHRVQALREKERHIDTQRATLEEHQSVLLHEAEGVSHKDLEVRAMAEQLDLFRTRPRRDVSTQTSVATSDKSTIARGEAIQENVNLNIPVKKPGPWSAFTTELLKGLAEDAIVDMDRPVPQSPEQEGGQNGRSPDMFSADVERIRERAVAAYEREAGGGGGGGGGVGGGGGGGGMQRALSRSSSSFISPTRRPPVGGGGGGGGYPSPPLHAVPTPVVPPVSPQMGARTASLYGHSPQYTRNIAGPTPRTSPSFPPVM